MALTKVTSNVLGNSAVTSAKIALSNTGLTFNDGSNQLTAASSFGFKNRVINGAMIFDQRNVGVAKTSQAVASSPFLCDRFRFGGGGGASRMTTQQVQDAPPGFVNSLKFTVTTTETLSAGSVNVVSHIIEGANVVDFAWGTSSATSATLSFWVKTSLTGTHAVAIRSDGPSNNYSYVASYTVNQANTWEYKTIAVPAITLGSWGGLTASTTYGIRLDWNIGSYTDVQTAANTWTSGGYFTVAGANQIITNNGATFQLTGVQFEKGPTATAFDYRPYGLELSLCQRYYQKYGGEGAGWQSIASGQVESATLAGMNLVYIVPMRAAPTVTKSGDMRVQAGTNWMTFTLGTVYAGKNSCSINLNITGGTGGQGMIVRNYNDGTAYMDFSAEL